MYNLLEQATTLSSGFFQAYATSDLPDDAAVSETLKIISNLSPTEFAKRLKGSSNKYRQHFEVPLP